MLHSCVPPGKAGECICRMADMWVNIYAERQDVVDKSADDEHGRQTQPNWFTGYQGELLTVVAELGSRVIGIGKETAGRLLWEPARMRGADLAG